MRKLAITVIIAICFALVVPDLGHARRYYGHYRGGCGYSNDYWVPAAIIGGTFLASALIMGAMSQSSRQAPPPQAQRPVQPTGPYASPDPDFVARYGDRPQASGGEWVIVPGQQVGDRWVPAHRVFVPGS